jgi:hypothetical protein
MRLDGEQSRTADRATSEGGVAEYDKISGCVWLKDTKIRFCDSGLEPARKTIAHLGSESKCQSVQPQS